LPFTDRILHTSEVSEVAANINKDLQKGLTAHDEAKNKEKEKSKSTTHEDHK
jgi:hypothetical protein